MTFQLRSPSFRPDAEIPRVHTAQGDDVSPPLTWSDPPPATKSFALIVDDPDAPDPRAPKRTWVHWVLYHIPPGERALPEGATQKTLPRGTIEGRNDWHEARWRGPSPPVGTHRYFFKLYALDTSLEELAAGASKKDVEEAMAGHILDTATMVGTYHKS